MTTRRWKGKAGPRANSLTEHDPVVGDLGRKVVWTEHQSLMSIVISILTWQMRQQALKGQVWTFLRCPDIATYSHALNMKLSETHGRKHLLMPFTIKQKGKILTIRRHHLYAFKGNYLQHHRLNHKLFFRQHLSYEKDAK